MTDTAATVVSDLRATTRLQTRKEGRSCKATGRRSAGTPQRPLTAHLLRTGERPMTELNAIIPAARGGALNLNDADAETKAVWAFLARYRNDRTRRNYRMDIDQFAYWCRRDAELPSMLAAERMHAELYLRYMQRLGLADSTVARRFGTVRKLCYIGSDSGAGSLARQLLAGVYANTAR